MRPVFLIAEAGVNHNGSPDLAVLLVEDAARAGVDAVKFQTFRAEDLVNRSAQKADYQKAATGISESQWEMLKRLELGHEEHFRLSKRCDELGIEFMSTPFDPPSLRFLVDELKIKRLKISSGEITNAPFLIDCARTGLPIILSTGMSTMDEVRNALGVLAFGYARKVDAQPSAAAFALAFSDHAAVALLRRNVILLHCTTEYPAPLDDVNLSAMRAMGETLGCAFGYSDHTVGIAVSIAATALGACVIEKHFTLDKKMEGPDHEASIEPQELHLLVAAVRDVERAIGAPEKRPARSELGNMKVARKSLVALRPVRKGDILSVDNLGVKRPGTGISPMDYWIWLGKPAPRDLREDEVL